MSELVGENLIEKSLTIAIEAHKGQLRRDGRTPYIIHPVTVASKFKSPILQSIALLHDVIEDTNVTKDDLIKQNIPNMVINAVEALTDKKDEKYIDYILRVNKNLLAIEVKREDIAHNYPTSGKNQKAKYDLALYILRKEKSWN